MIVFDLVCECGAQVEGWFRDHAEFDSQLKQGVICCPRCGNDSGIRKVLSPVYYQKSSFRNDPGHRRAAAGEADRSPEMAETAARTLRAVREFVEYHFEDVGSDFAKQTLKMHFGVEEARNIRGVVTPEEEKMLDREGIDYLKIPVLPKEDNGSN